MKIGLLVPGFSSDESDWCIPALLDFARCLAAGPEVHVFALRYPHRFDRYTVYGTTVHSLNGAGAGGLGSPALWARAVRAIAEEHRRGAFDVLHAFWAYEPGPIAVWAGRRLGIPAVVSLAGGELVSRRDIRYGLQLRPHRRALIRWALRHAQAVTAGSRHLLCQAESWSDRVALAPLGVDTELFFPADGPNTVGGTQLILNVASLLPVKDQSTLLRAFAAVGADFPGARLAVAGADAGELRASLAHLARQLTIETRVDFLGALPHDALPGLYRSAAFCVQSSLHEAQGMAVLEAAACGVPTVGTAVGVLPELMPAEWLGPAADATALARLMRAGLGAPEPLREIGGVLRERVVRDFSLAASQERFLNLYAALSVPGPS